MRVEAKHFHPMRGHVEDGAEIVLSNGSVLTLRSRMLSWALVDKDGVDVRPAAHDCWELTGQVVELDRS